MRTMRAYYDEQPLADRKQARADGITEDDGRTWHYEHSGVDEFGDYDLWVLSSDAPPLTKLEQFTMAAMQGLCSNPFISETLAESGAGSEKQFDIIAESSIAVSQATLAQLEETDT